MSLWKQVPFFGIPPEVHFYSKDGYAGYLGRVSYYYNASEKKYYATYAGRIYDSPPYPFPSSINIEDEN